MLTKKQQLEQDKREQPTSIITKSLMTGFIGGLFWGFMGWFASFFNFTSVSPATFMIRSWLNQDWTNGWLAELLAIILIGVLSLAVAIIYYLLLKKLRGLWPSAIFGVVLWGIVFYVLLPIFPNISALNQLSGDTIVTTICLFLLYGIFIGYSISYDYLDTVTKKNI
ncbi:YqhR family membrane protein [Paraliobacillus sediminis]|uniref:YqhR family membrane protein n=1 Tax=Paraliobacillus sediminis TaxID=1885916 RepID=UPI000E3EB70B|nr:YqhR family membrane protein [Paraliobacillus sediminis]